MRARERQARRSYGLLLYRRLESYYRIPCLWLLIVSLGLLVWDHPSLRGLKLTALLSALLSGTLILVTLAMSRLAYVRCAEDGLMVRVPLRRIHVPYDYIVQTRTSALGLLFPPSRQSFSSRAFLGPLWHLPAVIVELERMPQKRRRLRLWMDSRMLLKGGLVLLVRDHRELRNEIDEATIRWRMSLRESLDT